MSRAGALWSRLRGIVARSARISETDEEIRLHLEMLAERLIRKGTPPDEAHYQALQQFGGVMRMKEQQYETAGFPAMEALFRDMKYSLRAMTKNPGFTSAVALTLGLGIGTNVAIFSAVNSILLKPLPFKNSDQIVMLWGVTPDGNGWRGKTNFSAPNFLDLKARNHSFQSMSTFGHQMFVLTDGTPALVKAGMVGAEFFDVLNLRPIFGRVFAAEEAQPGRDHVLVLGNRLWKSRFHSDPGIVGQSVRLNAVPYTVIGVLPEFDFTIPGHYGRSDLWAPAIVPLSGKPRSLHYLSVIARLKAGISLQQGQQDMNFVTSRLVAEYPKNMPGLRTILVRLHD